MTRTDRARRTVLFLLAVLFVLACTISMTLVTGPVSP